MDLSIGALARHTGVKIPTIRFYEAIGLLPVPPRAANNRRRYGPEAERRLRFIRHARALGFEVPAIRDLLALADQPQKACADVDAITRTHLSDIDQKIAQLTALRQEIARMVETPCDGIVSSCRVIDALADHGKCIHEAHYSIPGAAGASPPSRTLRSM